MQNYSFAKKFTALAVFIFLGFVMLFSCSKSIIDINIQDLDKVIREKIDFSEHDDHSYDEYSSDRIKSIFGIGENDAVQIIIRKKVDFNNPFNEEIMILAEAKSNDKAKEIEAKLTEYRAQRLKILTDYTVRGNEEQYYLVEASEIIVKQRYVFWVVDARRTEINAVIEQYIKDNGTKS